MQIQDGSNKGNVFSAADIEALRVDSLSRFIVEDDDDWEEEVDEWEDDLVDDDDWEDEVDEWEDDLVDDVWEKLDIAPGLDSNNCHFN